MMIDTLMKVININKISYIPFLTFEDHPNLLNGNIILACITEKNEDCTIYLDNWVRLIVTAEPKNAHGKLHFVVYWLLQQNRV